MIHRIAAFVIGIRGRFLQNWALGSVLNAVKRHGGTAQRQLAFGANTVVRVPIPVLFGLDSPLAFAHASVFIGWSRCHDAHTEIYVHSLWQPLKGNRFTTQSAMKWEKIRDATPGLSVAWSRLDGRQYGSTKGLLHTLDLRQPLR